MYNWADLDLYFGGWEGGGEVMQLRENETIMVQNVLAKVCKVE